MRLLCTCLPGYGHFLPMLPFARAVAAAGHEVAFATAGEFCPRIEKAGFAAFPAGLSMPDQLAAAAAQYPDEHGMAPGKERFEAFVPRMLGGVAAPARARDLVPVVRDWRPDVLVHDEADFGGPVAAAVVGIPYADHSLGFLRPPQMARRAREAVAALWDDYDVDLGEYGGLYRYLYLDVCPPSLQSEGIDEIAVAHPMRNTDLPVGDQALPAWIHDLRPAPTVYVSLGTIFNTSQELFATILDGLRDEYVNVVVTVGNANDPAALGPQPAHVRVERFIPQEALLPHCDVVVNQGGTAILPILAHGLPLLVLPQSANQFHQAEACADAGVARVLQPAAVTAAAVRDGVRALLADEHHAERCRAVQAELAAMPAPGDVVALVEQLARDRAPLVRTGVPS